MHRAFRESVRSTTRLNASLSPPPSLTSHVIAREIFTHTDTYGVCMCDGYARIYQWRYCWRMRRRNASVVHECPRRIAILDDYSPTDVIVHCGYTIYEKLREIAATLDHFAIQAICFSGNVILLSKSDTLTKKFWLKKIKANKVFISF